LKVNEQVKAEVDHFRIERGSVDNRLARVALREAAAATDHRNELLPVQGLRRFMGSGGDCGSVTGRSASALGILAATE
jgi:hypothetical protein